MAVILYLNVCESDQNYTLKYSYYINVQEEPTKLKLFLNRIK